MRLCGFARTLLPFLLISGFAVPALAQQTDPTQAIIQQPFGQKPPPPPPPAPTPEQQQQLDREHHRLPSWLYRGLVAAAARTDEAVEIDTPVTGYGNEALWDVPELLSATVAVPRARTQPKVAVVRRRR